MRTASEMAADAAVLGYLHAVRDAHRHLYVNVGRTGENRYRGECSCGSWHPAGIMTIGQLRRDFDQHLVLVYGQYAQDFCFCLRLVFESPLQPGRWVHADYMHEYYGHDPVVLERTA
jgi:hypothetical protein